MNGAGAPKWAAAWDAATEGSEQRDLSGAKDNEAQLWVRVRESLEIRALRSRNVPE